MTLQALVDHCAAIYERRNRIFLPGLHAIIAYLQCGIGDLQDVIRKSAPSDAVATALARVVVRIFNVISYFRVPFGEVMAQKYPRAHCSYCLRMPCGCEESRSVPKLEGEISHGQRAWTLTEWRAHLAALYGERNRQKGIENLLTRLFKEIVELTSLEMTIPQTEMRIEEIERAFALEAADALAWTIAVANLLDVDLEAAVNARYGNGCWKCGKPECVCTHFNFESLDW